MNHIVVTLPAYNEQDSIKNVLDNITGVMSNCCYPQATWQVVVVDDCSSDETASRAESCGALVICLPAKAGLAQVFRQEIQMALSLDADWIVHLDSDGQHPPEAIPLLLTQLEQGYDLVVGSRFLKHTPRGKPFIERFESRSFSRLLSWITGSQFTDVHSGFRAFTRRLAQEVPIRSSFSYTREQLFRAAGRGFKVVEVPITVLPRLYGPSRLIKSRYRTMLTITREFAIWNWEERFSPVKIPIILAWGGGTVAISWLFRCFYQVGSMVRCLKRHLELPG